MIDDLNVVVNLLRTKLKEVGVSLEFWNHPHSDVVCEWHSVKTSLRIESYKGAKITPDYLAELLFGQVVHRINKYIEDNQLSTPIINAETVVYQLYPKSWLESHPTLLKLN